MMSVATFLSPYTFGQQPDAAFFESKIRPVLSTRCFGCHSSRLPSPKGELVLDTKAGLSKGGVSGPVVIPGKPEESRLIRAIRYSDENLHMPPSGKLPDAVIADFENWVQGGAIDPRTDAAVTSKSSGPLKGMSIEDGKKWWAFLPVKQMPAPTVRDTSWAKQKIDAFLLAKLEEKGLKPSSEADRATLAQRLYVDIVGYKPSYEEIEEFKNDTSPNAYEKLVDKLLASPHYGERWGRRWMDVARFGEDNPTSEATNPGYPFAYRYRDWVIEAVNQDVPYDRFVKLQLAADIMKDAKRSDMRALGYLGASPVYHKDMRLSRDVIYGFMTDDWDERIDAVSRGLLGMTVGCARCHDHKFDAIPTKDYYGLAGVFASTMRAERPTFDIDPQTETRFMWVSNRLFDLSYAAGLMIRETSTIEDAPKKLEVVQAEIRQLKAEMEALGGRYPQLVQRVEKYWVSGLRPLKIPPDPDPPRNNATERKERIDRGGAPLTDPFMNTVYEASQTVNGNDPKLTWIDVRPGEARDLPVMRAGNVANTGDISPRHFLTVLSNGDTTFKQGSGRLELGERIFTDGASLASRVIVNRVWDWHFGRGLVGTPSDYGVQGEKPTHPELLDDLAARFIANGWSLKWLHREMLLSAAYRQSSRTRGEGERIDQTNNLLWRMNPRRLDIEAYRDSMLRSAGVLSEELYGFAGEVDDPANVRRTVYGHLSRKKLNPLLKTYDFPDPIQTAGGRILTTTSLQQLFALNSDFFQSLASKLAASVAGETDDTARVRILYRKILSRDPSAGEIGLALDYLKQGTMSLYAQVLLATNEEIFWP